MTEKAWYAGTYLTAAELASRDGPLTSERYAYVVEFDAHFAWYLGDTDTADDINIIEPSGGGQGRWKRIRGTSTGNDLGDGNATIQVGGTGGGQWRVLPDGTLTGASQLTLGTTYAVTGDRITITRLDTEAYTYTIVNGGGGGGTLATFPVSKKAFLDAEFDGTNWVAKRSAEML